MSLGSHLFQLIFELGKIVPSQQPTMTLPNPTWLTATFIVMEIPCRSAAPLSQVSCEPTTCYVLSEWNFSEATDYFEHTALKMLPTTNNT